MIHGPFAMVARSVLNDKRMTMRAKGLFAYLYSKPPEWDFNYKRIADDHKESKNVVLVTIRELESLGYLVRQKLHTGRTLYHLTYDISLPEWKERLANMGIACAQNLLVGNSGTVSKIVSESNKDFANSEISGVFPHNSLNPAQGSVESGPPPIVTAAPPSKEERSKLQARFKDFYPFLAESLRKVADADIIPPPIPQARAAFNRVSKYTDDQIKEIIRSFCLTPIAKEHPTVNAALSTASINRWIMSNRKSRYFQ